MLGDQLERLHTSVLLRNTTRCMQYGKFRRDGVYPRGKQWLTESKDTEYTPLSPIELAIDGHTVHRLMQKNGYFKSGNLDILATLKRNQALVALKGECTTRRFPFCCIATEVLS